MTADPLPPTILLVDDDATVRFLLRHQLRRHWPQVQVIEAENGVQGLALVHAHCQATQAPRSLLVLLDLNMPVMDGWEFLRHYQQLPERCHQATTVVVSSTSTQATEQAQAQAQADAWRPKPLLAEHIKELVGQYLPAALPA